MFSAIVSSLMEKCEDEEEKHQLVITIISKLNKFPFKNKYLASALFDICLKQSNVKLFSNLDAKSVQTLAINLNLEPLGIQLLLRKPSTDSEPVAKRSRTETNRIDVDKPPWDQSTFSGKHIILQYHNWVNCKSDVTVCCRKVQILCLDVQPHEWVGE